jgi:ferritin-like metal-binding protein YciE
LLGKHGIDEVLVNTHWRREKVDSFVNSLTQRRKDAKRVNGLLEGGDNVCLRITNQQITNNSLKVRLFYEKELLGSAGTLLANRKWVADEGFAGRP